MSKDEIKELQEFYLRYADHISNWSEHSDNIMQLSEAFLKEFSTEINIISLLEYTIQKKLDAVQYNNQEIEGGYNKVISKLLRVSSDVSGYFSIAENHRDDFPSKHKDLFPNLCAIDDPELLKEFREYGFDLNHKNYPAIVLCADTKSIKNINFLIKEIVDINAQITNNSLFSSTVYYSAIKNGVTALMISCLIKDRGALYGNKTEKEIALFKKCAKALIDAGADLSIRDSDGQGIYHYLLSGLHAKKKVEYFEQIIKKK